MEKEGTYVISIEDTPRFRVDIEKSEKRWVASQIIIQECGGAGAFRYLPSLDKNPQTVTLETSIALKAKGEREKIAKKMFLDFHKEIKEIYQFGQSR
jgi:hypothetical protein